MIQNTQEMNQLSGKNAELELRLKTNFVDLASERVGGETLSCSDDFFAEMENLLKSGRGIFIDDKYTARGKWMDGWESRRSYGRDNGRDFDWCIIRLGIPGVIFGFDIDTNYFRGNAPQLVSVEACVCDSQPNRSTEWHTVLEKSEIDAHSQNIFEISNEQSWTHVRLNMFPDGGIARFRVYGKATVDWSKFVDGELIDLASIKNGAKALLVSDMFFSDKNNLIMPGRGKDMGDGWETKRRRDPGPDWSIVKLATKGSIEKVIVDTHHFKGNFPDSFTLEASVINDDDGNFEQASWQTIINKTKLYAHREHQFISEVLVDSSKRFTHVRLSIFPDGGISRMRVFGHLDEKMDKKDMALGEFNRLAKDEFENILMQCCTSSAWVARLLNARPFMNKGHLIESADNAWIGLKEADYLQAFEGHPKIGNVNSLREKYASTKKIASGEQQSVNEASEQVLIDLAKGNDEYFDKFGFIFIVCATGKSASEMLTILRERLPNDRETELRNAAEEQRKIFQIRLAKIFEDIK